MELKNALAVCLISFFSATLVLLIARALDIQAAARLEPQLSRIVQELEALRLQGGVVTAGAAGQTNSTLSDGLMVYYFHGSVRCPTCEAIESQSKAVVQTDFAAEMASGDLQWQVLDYEQPANAPLAEEFEIQAPIVVLARLQDGRVTDWKRLDEVWGLVGDEADFAAFLREQIRAMLPAGQPPAISVEAADDASDSTAESSATEIPIPADEIPIPD
jgi:hypothetical protein